MLGRIFAHRGRRRTVVEAPLVATEEPPGEPPVADAAPPVPPPGPARPPVEPLPTEPPPVEPLPPRAPPREAPRAPAPPSSGPPPSAPPAPPPPPADPLPAHAGPATPVADARRYCPMCGDRVPVEPDGLHCYLGHRLSPAHAERRRGGLLRRLFRRR